MPDNDAVDYDDVENGIIRNSVIHDFLGFNSDAIDIGEKAENISIENILVYNVVDKGVSVGQQSSAHISNSVFVNCNMGAGLKDSSRVFINHCTFYGNGTSIACYEKNEGDAGGNGVVTNSILSNTYEASFSADAMSTLRFSNSLTDNDFLPDEKSNLFVNPQFQNPNIFDFRLAFNSPCILSGSDGNMGANLNINETINQLYISAIAYKSDSISEVVEFIELSNSGNTGIDLSGYEFTKGITFIFPEGSTIEAGEKVYVTYNSGSDFWINKELVVYQWESGRLADEGEAIQLKTPQGVVADQVFYNFDLSWPAVSSGEAIKLKSEKLDNHFSENWKVSNMNTIVHAENRVTNFSNLRFFPNPTSGILHISGLEMEEELLNIYNLTGVLVKSQMVNSTHSQINIENLNPGIYIVRCGNVSQRVVLMK